MPKVYIIPQPSPNAFATGRNPEHAAVAATEGILRILNDEELDGVIAHELAHVKHRDILISSVAATLAAAIMMTSRFAMFWGAGGDRRDSERGNPVVLLATMILAPLAAMLIRRRSPVRASSMPTRAAQASPAIRSAWSTRSGSSKRRRTPCRSTPIPQPRTCSSSSRSPSPA